MVKHCEVCNRDYPAESNHCPYCATKVSHHSADAAAKSEEQTWETVQQPAAAEADDAGVASFDTEPVDMDAVLKDVPTSPPEHGTAAPTGDVPATPTLDWPSAAPTGPAPEVEEPPQFATTRDISELYREQVQKNRAPAGTPTQLAPEAAVTPIAKPAVIDAAMQQPPTEHAESKQPPDNPDVDDLAAELAETVGHPRPTDDLFRSATNLRGDEAVDFTQEPADFGVDASQVNLGTSSPTVHGLTESRLNMSEDALETKAAPGDEFPPPPIAEDEPAGAEAAVETEEEPQAVEEPAAAKEKPGLRRHLAGGVVGLLVGGAACIALAVFNVLPIDSLKEAVGTAAAKPSPAPQPQPQAAAPTPAATQPAPPALSGEQYLAVGDFGKAVEALAAADTPEARTKRGLARWLQYVQQQKQANAALNPEEDAVAQAKKDLAEANTPEAKYWLGHITEMTAGPAAARKVYEEGAKQFKDQSRLFQSALDRLDALADDKGAGPVSHGGAVPDGRTSLLLVIATALQAEGAQANATPEAAEAGFDFWRAAKLAKEFKYDEAIATLQKARTTHEQQRLLRLRQAQNPTSDPTEQIFLRCCDELAAAWKVRQVLARDGYLAAGKQADPVKALEGALAAAKAGAGQPKDSALPAVVARLKKEKDVTASDPEVKDVVKAVGVLAKARSTAESRLAEATKEADKALQDKKAADDQVATLKTKCEEAEGSFQEIKKRLIDAKYLETSADRAAVVQGIEKLVAGTSAPTIATLAQLVAQLSAVGAVAGDRLAFGVEFGGHLAADQAASVLRQVGTSPRAVAAGGRKLPADPEASERHFSAAFRLYWTRKYPEAEREIMQAIAYNDQDARYVYYLGLIQLAQGNQDAARQSFRRAGRLEQQQRPHRELVSASLERVQGADRRVLNNYRP